MPFTNMIKIFKYKCFAESGVLQGVKELTIRMDSTVCPILYEILQNSKKKEKIGK
jgi:hypothetical protein